MDGSLGHSCAVVNSVLGVGVRECQLGIVLNEPLSDGVRAVWNVVPCDRSVIRELCVDGVLYTLDGGPSDGVPYTVDGGGSEGVEYSVEGGCSDGADSDVYTPTVSTTDGVRVPLAATDEHDDESVQSDVAHKS